MATPEFRSSTERDRWKHAGSPLPIGFEPRHDKKFEEEEKQADHKILQSSRGVLDFETVQPESGPEIYPDLSGVPTDPKELRRAIGNHEVPGVADEAGRATGVERSIEALGTLLSAEREPGAEGRRLQCLGRNSGSRAEPRSQRSDRAKRLRRQLRTG